jgi:anti-sigma regulatory factor (Ser/Thr protein kinase)
LIAGADFVLTQAVLPVLNTAALIQANSILTMEESLQAAAEERDLFAADLAAHNYPVADSRLVNQLMVQHWELWNQATSSLDGHYLDFFTTDVPTAIAAHLTDLESAVAASPRSALRVSLREWTSVNSTYAAGFRKALHRSSDAIRATALAEARTVLIRLILIGGLGLLAILGAIAIAIILSRALLQQLDDLRLSALDLSSVRLPAVLARLRSGEEIDVATETPQLDPGDNEIGQLGRAFNIAARSAVAAAVDEADIRRGVNDVFRNLARRNQSLLTRQLELLDAMERRVHDPEELADLFRVDHLTTRMRRHAEGLLIVAGGSSGRVWREPVAIVDVMRAAVAEIEDYTRIRVTSRSSSSVAGHAVADIIHMLAELVENATTFSPANTPVRIESDNVAKGLVVEIEDRGLGMTDTQIDEINSKLNDPPQLDLSGSEQLGLFIAGQLARRHDVKITMRGSAYGGVVAVVLIPSTLVIDPGYDEPLTVVGIRELGGRPVPQLPAAALVEESATAASVPSPDFVSAAGYILDLDAGSDSVTTTASQIDVGPLAPTRPGAGPDDTGVPQPFADDHGPVEVIQADLVEAEAIPSEADAVGSGTARAEDEPAGLKGAGAWLTEAEAATPHQPGDSYGAAGQAAADVWPPQAPMLILGPEAGAGVAPVTPHPLATPFSAAAPLPPATPLPAASRPPERERQAVGWPAYADGDQAGESIGLPSRATPAADELNDGSVGWPDRHVASADWLNLVSGLSSAADSPPSGAADPPRRDDTADLDSTALPRRAAPLPQRQPRPPGAAPGHDLADTDSFGPVPSTPSPVELEGLPVRVRQASLAPQLRDQMTPAQAAERYVAAPEMPPEQTATSSPSPEAARSFMSSLQRGWERGRTMAEQMTDEPDGEQS